MFDHTGIANRFLPLFVLVLCTQYDFQFVSGETRCLEKEREALLRFKEGLDLGVLSSWNENTECCEWSGVVCSNMTGHVIALELGGLDGRLSGNISSSLIELQYLDYLDLSYNDFGGNRIPEFIGSIKRLKHLYLIWSNFSGIIPPQLGNLTSLTTLNLWGNNLRSDSLSWLSHLSLLSLLDLSFSNISDTNWPLQVVKLRSLQKLHFQYCMLPDVTSSAGHFINSSTTKLSLLELSHNELTSFTFDRLFNISTSLAILDLSFNRLDGPIPDAFQNFPSLEDLYLDNNALVGGIPKSLWNLSHLQYLRLDHNKLTGLVHENLGQLSKLTSLDFSFNYLEGTISEVHFLKLDNLEELTLAYNSLTLNLSTHWVPPFHLDRIDLARCKIGKSFPKWLQTQINYTYLDISAVGISDEMPTWFWNVSRSIEHLNLSNNLITGTIPDSSSMDRAELIDVSSNKFSGPVPLFNQYTAIFQLSKNMFSGPISSSICTVVDSCIKFLDLSDNQLAGALPNCWEIFTDLRVLNLNNNNFSGEIPHAYSRGLASLHLRNNNFSGEIPLGLKYCRNLLLIDVGGNKLTGNVPSWFGGNYPYLTYLSLRENRFYGGIPPQICNLTHIQLLDLSENNFSGKIPNCFNNFASLVDKNKSSTNVIVIHSVASVDYTDYELVQWKGKESEYKYNLELLKLIDLSSNKLAGDIPTTFSTLRALISLNLSRNYLTGSIDPNIGHMEMLEIIDYSRNQLWGEIPIGLTQLHYLAVLDLSDNNLSGKIPLGTQLQSFNCSSYEGNRELCGLPLALCPGDHDVPHISNGGENGNTGHDKYFWFLRTSFVQGPWISVILGFIVGFWGVVGSLFLKKLWRTAYFNFLDDVRDWMFVVGIMFLRKFKRNRI